MTRWRWTTRRRRAARMGAVDGIGTRRRLDDKATRRYGDVVAMTPTADNGRRETTGGGTARRRRRIGRGRMRRRSRVEGRAAGGHTAARRAALRDCRFAAALLAVALDLGFAAAATGLYSRCRRAVVLSPCRRAVVVPSGCRRCRRCRWCHGPSSPHHRHTTPTQCTVRD
jgi:hypothetical protein